MGQQPTLEFVGCSHRKELQILEF